LPSGPPPSGNFTIDLSSLKKEFLQLQSRAHPDLHPASQKNKAQAASARINEAYKTLQSPLRRAQYLLSLKGIDVVEDETAKIEDPELLMEVMEMQEEIEEAETEQDLEGMKRHNDGRIERSVENLEEAFKRDDIQSAKNEAVRLRYWINIKESLDGWEKGKPISLEH
jgi:molecular chaperone HscB